MKLTMVQFSKNIANEIFRKSDIYDVGGVPCPRKMPVSPFRVNGFCFKTSLEASLNSTMSFRTRE
jgi:hypothetical protein